MMPSPRIAVALRCTLALLLALSPIVPAAAAIRISSIKTTPSSLGTGAAGSGISAKILTQGTQGAAGLIPLSLTSGLPSVSGTVNKRSKTAPASASGATQIRSPQSVKSAVLPRAEQTVVSSQQQEKKDSPGAVGFLGALSKAKLPAILWNNSKIHARSDISVPVTGRLSSQWARLRAQDSDLHFIDEAPEPETPPAAAEKIDIPKASLGRLVRDSLQYYHITASSLGWYTFPRFIQRWRGLMRSHANAEGKKLSVRDYRGFFIAHRVMGSTGNYAPMGFRIAASPFVTRDAEKIFSRYFTPNRSSETAFLRLIRRARRYNPNRRSTQFRKIIFHALRAGSVLTIEELPAFFDSLATEENAAALMDYQLTRQQLILDTFESLVNKTVLELNAGRPAGNRVVGALLLGSFANHAAGPGSDLDIQMITEDGSAVAIPAFMSRLKQRWGSAGLAEEHPIGAFQYGLPLSKNLLMRVHIESYIIFSPYRDVLKAMRLTAEEEAGGTPAGVRTVRGYMFQLFYTQVLRGVLAGYEIYYFVRKKLGI